MSYSRVGFEGENSFLKKLKFELEKSLDEAKELICNINSPADLANLLEIQLGQLLYILYKHPIEKKYKIFNLEKKNGGQRRISSPIGSIRILQKKVEPILRSHYRRKNSVHGFVKERSILTNAQSHKRKRYVFNIDLEDFYGSINFGRVQGLFKSKPFNMDAKAAAVLAHLCTLDRSLPQGACTSPVISNYIASDLDKRLMKVARRYHLTYTRYADDITFSSNKRVFPESIGYYDGDNPITGETYVGQVVEEAIAASGFAINYAKVRLQIKGIRQDVTGLTVNDLPNVRRSYIRNIRALIHNWRKNENNLNIVESLYREKYAKNKSRFFDNDKYYFKEALYGKLAFLKMIRGESEIYLRFCRDIAELDSNPPQIIVDMKKKYKMYDVFISHASEDKEEIARPIAEECTKLGLHPFLDEDELQWGDSLTDVLNQVLGKTKYFIAILSENSIDKKWPKKEINTALARHIDGGDQKFLPLLVNKPDLSGLGLVSDLLHLEWSGNAEYIAKKINKIANKSNNAPEGEIG